MALELGITRVLSFENVLGLRRFGMPPTALHDTFCPCITIPSHPIPALKLNKTLYTVFAY